METGNQIVFNFFEIHFWEKQKKDEEICLQYGKSEKQLADILIKPLTKQGFEVLRRMLGIVSKNVEEC